jgi:hypothetical protein
LEMMHLPRRKGDSRAERHEMGGLCCIARL